ncbi:hypothetical protein CBM2586_B10553 [Cupriavidus phytorum]|uniref:Uncharacterized protein n=1 Tax=Cupriavidus taiwanensis TaxID=164546 RepID=A0A375C9Y5_9BURK|nr:hypothetical protein CBM2586_B10553 [Cupriavidus taiwanensis]
MRLLSGLSTVLAWGGDAYPFLRAVAMPGQTCPNAGKRFTLDKLMRIECTMSDVHRQSRKHGT